MSDNDDIEVDSDVSTAIFYHFKDVNLLADDLAEVAAQLALAYVTNKLASCFSVWYEISLSGFLLIVK